MLRLAGRTRSHLIHVHVRRPAISCTANASSSIRSHLKQPSVSLPLDDHPNLFKRIHSRLSSLHSNGEGPTNSQVDAFNDAVASLCASLEQDQLHVAWQHWLVLEQQKLLGFLGPSQLDLISRAIAGVFDGSRPYDEDEVRAIEELALAAAGHAPDALIAVMIHHIRRKNSDAVLALDRRYMQLLIEKGDWKGKESVGEDEEVQGDALASTSMPESHHSYGKSVHVQLAVTAAYAMKDSFEAALQACLSSNIRPFTFPLKPFLRRLRLESSLRDKVEDYSRRLGTARLIVRSPSFVKHITNLANDQSIDSLQKLYATIIEGLSGPNAYLAAHPSVMDSQRIVLVPDLAWPAFLSAFMKCRRVDLAETLWDDVIRFGIRPGTSLWTALFDGYANIRAIPQILKGWDTMISEGVVPDPLTHRALISALFDGRRPDEAMKRFKTFENENMKQTLKWQSEHILPVYNTVLHGLLQASREKEALELLQTMKDRGPHPDLVSYNTMLRYYGRMGDFKAVAAHVRDLSSHGLVGDVFTYSTILSALLRVGREDAPEIMVNFMKKQRCRSSNPTG